MLNIDRIDYLYILKKRFNVSKFRNKDEEKDVKLLKTF